MGEFRDYEWIGSEKQQKTGKEITQEDL